MDQIWRYCKLLTIPNRINKKKLNAVRGKTTTVLWSLKEKRKSKQIQISPEVDPLCISGCSIVVDPFIAVARPDWAKNCWCSRICCIWSVRRLLLLNFPRFLHPQKHNFVVSCRNVFGNYEQATKTGKYFSHIYPRQFGFRYFVGHFLYCFIHGVALYMIFCSGLYMI